MSAVKKQFRFFVNFEKEEAWLNQMSHNGWHLRSVSLFNVYSFEKGEPQNRNYRVDCRTFNKKKDLEDYISLFTDCGWVSIDAKMYQYNYYFYTQDPLCSQDIFSDKASKAQRYLRFSQAFLFSGAVVMLPYIGLYGSSVFKAYDIGYQTPNLWTMPKEKFISHFLFETPFVVFRALIYGLPIFMFLACTYFVIRFYVQYKKDIKIFD